MGSEIAQTQGQHQDRLSVVMESVRSEIYTAVSGWMDGDQFATQIMISLSDRSLEECTIRSKVVAALRCAALQLLPAAGHVALHARRINLAKRNEPPIWETEACVVPQWQGFQSLMLRNSGVRSVNAYLVHKNDRFSLSIEGARETVVHEFDTFDPERKIETLEDIKGGYVRIERTDGSCVYHLTPVSKIRKMRSCAETTVIWDKWFAEMALKSCFRDTFGRRKIGFDPLVECRAQILQRADDEAQGALPDRVPARSVRQTLTSALASNPAPRIESQEAPTSREKSEEEALYAETMISINGAETVKEVAAAMKKAATGLSPTLVSELKSLADAKRASFEPTKKKPNKPIDPGVSAADAALIERIRKITNGEELEALEDSLEGNGSKHVYAAIGEQQAKIGM